VEHRHVFVTGLHRSGTSLLAGLIARHPEVSAFSDTGVPEDEGQLLQTVYPRGKDHGGPGRFGFADEQHITEDSPLATASSRRALWEQWSPHWDLDRPVLLEKSPPHLTKTRFLQALFPGARFVVVTRHPIAVACATQKWSATRPDQLIRHWVRCHETFASDRPHLEHVHVLRYEDLVAHPDAKMAGVWSFLELSPMASGMALRQGINERYFAEWRARRRNPARSIYLEAVERIWDRRVRRWGYSLRRPAEATGTIGAA
jgi:sulfotransferase family protein